MLACAAAALTLGPAASVATAETVERRAALGREEAAVSGDVAVDPDGTTVVAWAADGGAVRAAVRPAGAGFGPTTTLAPDGGHAASVALDSHGGALVAWSHNGALGLAERTHDQAQLSTVPTAIGGVQDGPDVAFVAPGRAVVVWVGVDGAVHALSRAIGGASNPLADLDTGAGNSDPQLAAANGHAVAAWTATLRAGSQITTRVRASVLGPQAAFEPPEDVASATHDESASDGAQLAARKVAMSPSAPLTS